MRKFSMLSVLIGLLLVGLFMVACDKDDERVTSTDALNSVTFNASDRGDIYQEANALAMELTGYTYDEIRVFYYESENADAFKEPALTVPAMAPNGHWYCWVLLMGCLMGCDQNHGGALCEEICFRSYNSCNGGTATTGNISVY